MISQPYLIFVHFGTPPHYLGLYTKKCVNWQQNSLNWSKWAKISHSLCQKVHRLEKNSPTWVLWLGLISALVIRFFIGLLDCMRKEDSLMGIYPISGSRHLGSLSVLFRAWKKVEEGSRGPWVLSKCAICLSRS